MITELIEEDTKEERDYTLFDVANALSMGVVILRAIALNNDGETMETMLHISRQINTCRLAVASLNAGVPI